VPLFDQVRVTCREVAAQAEAVRIDFDLLPGYAASLPFDELASPEHDPRHHYLGQGEATLTFFLVLDTINFGSGYFPHLRKRPGLSGYFTVATTLTERFRSHGPPSASELAALSAGDSAALFGQDLDEPPIAELMALFARALNDLGRLVDCRYGGRFASLVEAAEGSSERLVELMLEMPLFQDVQPYRGKRVPFYKRAQLTVADLKLAFGGQGWGAFDTSQLTIFADNLVPHVLRVDGLLRYDPALAARIDREEPIPRDAPEEVEIRACGLHAVELLVRALAERGRQTTATDLDYLLWNRGQGTRYKAIPRHRARSTAY
jgi:hypothetical protein